MLGISTLIILHVAAMPVAGRAMVAAASDWPLPFSAACSPFDSCGNHRYRATWNSTQSGRSAFALRVRLEWRRPRFGPTPSVVLARLLHPKPGSSVEVRNVLVHPSSTHEAGDVVFDPENASAPGILLYWLPFSHGHTLKNGGNITVQYSLAAAERCDNPKGCNSSTISAVDPAWRARTLAAFDELPQLRAPVYEAHTELDRFGPLEWAATAVELTALAQQAGNRSVLPFVEPRERPILYLDAIPKDWATRGPDWQGGLFRGARKDEHFMMQVGLAAVRNISGFVLDRNSCIFSNLEQMIGTNVVQSDPRAIIPGSAISSPNLEGMTSRGKPFSRTLKVSGGRNGVLWIGVQIPVATPSGNYSGSVQLHLQVLHSTNMPRQVEVLVIPITLEVVDMDPVSSHGDLDAAHLTRARWLDSTLGIDDLPTARLGPLRLNRSSNAVSTSRGSEVVIDVTGLPRSITSTSAQYGELLADVMRFEVLGTNGEAFSNRSDDVLENELPSFSHSLDWNFSESTATWTGRTQVLHGVQTKSMLKLEVSGSMDFDGALYFNAAIQNAGPFSVSLDDIRLSVPIRLVAAPYMMGMGLQGGYSNVLHKQQHSWRWSIDPEHLIRNNMLWLGDPGLGLRLKLLPNGSEFDSGEYWIDQHSIPTYSWAGPRGPTIQYPFTSLFFNRTFYAGGANLSIAVDNQTIDVLVFSGPRVLQSGDAATFRFQVLLTPSCLPNVSAHFGQRYYQAGAPPPPLPDRVAVESFVEEEFVLPGYSVMNLHHGTILNPYLNWPLAQSALSLQTELAEALHARGFRLKVYLTVGQVSDHIEILPVLRSLDGEVLDLCDNQASEHPTNNEESDTGFCDTTASRQTYAYMHPGGYAWVQEHLGDGYVPTWTQPIGPPYTGNVDQALKNAQNAPNQLSRRMENYMVAAMSYLLEHPPHIDGLYLDGVSYDRLTMRRVRKVLDKARPGGVGLLDLHGANLYDIQQTDCCHPGCNALGAVCKGSWSGASSAALTYMDLLPYLDSVMFGEWFNYGNNFGHPGEDYWLVEISALPFGLFNDMLGSPYPTDPYKGMVFGSWARYGSGKHLYPDYHNNTALWAFITSTDLNQSSMIGYWNVSSPVRVSVGKNTTQAMLCDKIFATSYVISGVRTVVSVASWADADANCSLIVDYKQLGFNEVQSERARERGLVATAIDQFQPATRFEWDGDVLLESSVNFFGLSGQRNRPHIQPGWLLLIEP